MSSERNPLIQKCDDQQAEIERLSQKVADLQKIKAHEVMAKVNQELSESHARLLEVLRELHDFAEPSSHYRHGKRSREAFAKAAKLLNELEVKP